MRERATGLVLAALLVALGVSLSFLLQPLSPAGGQANTVTTTEPPPSGEIVVSVRVQDFSNAYEPAGGVSVGVASVTFPGVMESLKTNGSGMALFHASPGEYGVSVSDPRFSAHTEANVSGGLRTFVNASVSRTDYGVGFADAQVLGASQVVEPWELITVAVSPVTVSFNSTAGSAGGNFTLNPRASFGGTVFIDQFTCCFGATQSTETQAAVVSQGERGGSFYLELRPLAPLNLNGSFLLAVVTYQAKLNVLVAGGIVS